MKRAKNSRRKVWAKRIWITRNPVEYDYINIEAADFDQVRDDKPNATTPENSSARIVKAPWWYSFYRNHWKTLINGWLTKLIVGALIGSALTLLIQYLTKAT